MGDVGQFLSREWLRELGEVASADATLRGVAGDVRLAVHHRVTGGPDGDVDYLVRIGDGMVVVQPGDGRERADADPDPDVDVCMAYETAVAINRGELAPSQAFAAGRVRLGGRPGVLARHREALARLDDVFGELRARTTY
jgi:hypothetical protein